AARRGRQPGNCPAAPQTLPRGGGAFPPGPDAGAGHPSRPPQPRRRPAPRGPEESRGDALPAAPRAGRPRPRRRQLAAAVGAGAGAGPPVRPPAGHPRVPAPPQPAPACLAVMGRIRVDDDGVIGIDDRAVDEYADPEEVVVRGYVEVDEDEVAA